MTITCARAHRYDLANARSKVLELLNKKLSETIAVPTAQAGTSEIIDFARRASEHPRYNPPDEGNPAYGAMHDTLSTLLKLVDFFASYYVGDHNLARTQLEALSAYDIVPFSLSKVQACVANLDSIAVEVRACVHASACISGGVQASRMQLGLLLVVGSPAVTSPH